jgi:hypothetical protein
MQNITTALAIIAFSIASATTAWALDCRDWDRVSPDEQINMIEDQVSELLNSGAARSWNLNLRQVERCVLRRVQRIAVEVDDICAEGMSRGMRDADELIRRYIRSCVQ